jgi:hypothetical protein
MDRGRVVSSGTTSTVLAASGEIAEMIDESIL